MSSRARVQRDGRRDEVGDWERPGHLQLERRKPSLQARAPEIQVPRAAGRRRYVDKGVSGARADREVVAMAGERLLDDCVFVDRPIHGDLRRIVDESPDMNPEKDSIVYKVVAGTGFRTSGVMTRTEFARWARFELEQDEKEWKRIDT